MAAGQRPSVSLERERAEVPVKNDAKTPTLYPAFVLLALFSLGGCFFKGNFPDAGKDPDGKPVRSAESIFREALP
jgi:predicted small lipoprotein YifL